MENEILILIECEGQSHVCTMHEFENANRDDPELIEDVRCLAKGFGFTAGGGAAPVFHISRWS